MIEDKGELECTKDVTDIWWQDWRRDEAIVLIDGKFYTGINHQYAMTRFMKDYWTSLEYDLSDESDMGEAIAYTDYLFKNGRIHGFDLFSEGCAASYLISHYPRALKDKKTLALIKEYARKRGCQIGSFMNEEKLGGRCCLLAV